MFVRSGQGCGSLLVTQSVWPVCNVTSGFRDVTVHNRLWYDME